MKELLATILIIILAVAVFVQGLFIDEAQHTTGEALKIAERWQEAYTELQQDYSQAVERIEYLEHKLVTEPISQEMEQEIENNVPGEAESDEL